MEILNSDEIAHKEAPKWINLTETDLVIKKSLAYTSAQEGELVAVASVTRVEVRMWNNPSSGVPSKRHFIERGRQCGKIYRGHYSKP